MKIKQLVFALICAFLLVTTGCEKIYAEHSDNIEYVSAYYVVAGEDLEIEDRLQKTELIYTKMNITSKNSVNAAGISFDAKLKSGQQQELNIKIYVNKNDDSSTATQNTLVLASQTIEISDSYSTIEVIFDNVYTTEAASGSKITDREFICVEFLNEDSEKNTQTAFSLDNITLIEEEE